MHFGAVVLIPGHIPITEEAILDEVARLLEPYYIEREGPLRKEYFTEEAIRNLSRQFQPQPKSLPKLAEELHRKWSMDCHVDEGGLYYITTLNPDGKYDYFSLVRYEDITAHRVEAAVREHVWRTSEIPRDLLPAAVVTPDGQWHETGVKKWAWDITKDEEQAIRQRVFALVDQYPDHLAVLVDCHV